MTKLNILVVEDDELERGNIGAQLRGHSVQFAVTAGEARQKLQESTPDLCFIDLQLGENDTKCSGLKLIPLALKKGAYPVVMSGHSSESYVDRAYALGCQAFFDKGDVAGSVADVLERYERDGRPEELTEIFDTQYVTEDPATRESILQALKYGDSALPVLLLGPSGSGKTSLARLIHDKSGRQGEFVAINCSSYTGDLLEAELFGHRKGAFTDATENRRGKLSLAHNGTLFLDEIGAMPERTQTRLLKALEERSFYPIGSEKPETSDFRIISATLEEIPTLLRMGRLRADFFQRIHGVTVNLPPLSRRRSDIWPLVSFFNRRGRKLSFSTGAKERLMNHDWPGNVRELKKVIDMLRAGEEGRVSEERLQELLSSLEIRAVQGEAEMVTASQYRYALENGLNALLDRVAQAVVRKHLQENGGKTRQAIVELRTNPYAFYKALRDPMEVKSNG